MSHFSVIVIGNNIEEQLARYNENEFLENIYLNAETVNELQTKFNTNDSNPEKIKEFADWLEWWGGYSIDTDGIYYRGNHNAKWDWYKVGGRWDGFFAGRNTIKKRDLKEMEYPFAIVKNGEWFDKGQMGWFAMVQKPNFPYKKISQEQWVEECNKLLADVADDTMLTIVDCHI